MGARINYIFKDSEPAVGEPYSYVVLYSHWGETDWETDIAAALDHARPRWSDDSYCTRMIISYLIQDQLLDQHGFGIYSINDMSQDLGDTTVIVDMVNKTITNSDRGTELNWDSFVQAYGMLPPKVLVEQTV